MESIKIVDTNSLCKHTFQHWILCCSNQCVLSYAAAKGQTWGYVCPWLFADMVSLLLNMTCDNKKHAHCYVYYASGAPPATWSILFINYSILLQAMTGLLVK